MMEQTCDSALTALVNEQQLHTLDGVQNVIKNGHIENEHNTSDKESMSHVMFVQVNMNSAEQTMVSQAPHLSICGIHNQPTTSLQMDALQLETVSNPLQSGADGKGESLITPAPNMLELINENMCSKGIEKDVHGNDTSALWAAASELQAMLWNHDQPMAIPADSDQLQVNISTSEQISIDALEATLNVESSTNKPPLSVPVPSLPELKEVSRQETCFSSVIKGLSNESSFTNKSLLPPTNPTEDATFSKPRTMCIAPGCRNDRKQFKIDKKPFHWVPKDHLRAMLWYQALGIGPAESDAIQKKNPYPLVCCDHFLPTDYEGNTDSTPRPLQSFVRKRQLKKDVIPKPTGHLNEGGTNVPNPPVLPAEFVSAYSEGVPSCANSSEDARGSGDMSSSTDNATSTTAVFNERYPLPCTKPASACIAPGCPNTRYNMHKVNETRKDNPYNVLSFHSVPKDRQQAVLWYEALCLRCPDQSEATDKATSRYVCSDHFSGDDFEGNANLALQLGLEPPKRQLKRGAVPRMDVQASGGSNTETVQENKTMSPAQQVPSQVLDGMNGLEEDMPHTQSPDIVVQDDSLFEGPDSWLDSSQETVASWDSTQCVIAVPAQAEPIPADQPILTDVGSKLEDNPLPTITDVTEGLPIDVANLLSCGPVLNQDRRNRCLKCQRHFSNHNRLAAHERSCNKTPGKNNGMQFVCPKCEQQFQFSGHFAVHLRTCEKSMGQYSWKCRRCKQVFVGHSYYQVHQAHCQEPHLKCLLCTKAFTSQQHFTAHVKMCAASRNNENSCEYEVVNNPR